MKVRDVMTWNVVTVPSETPIMEAKKIMDAHHVLRLPVVDKGRLIGMTTRDRIDRAGPSDATSLSVWEINYLLAKMKVRDIMRKDVITVSPEMTVEAAIALAQNKGTGALPVVENGRLIGIVTTNDFFYRILNPILGIGETGVRLSVYGCNDTKCMASVMDAVAKSGFQVISVHTMKPPEGKEQEFCIHIDADNVDSLVKELESRGYNAEIRER